MLKAAAFVGRARTPERLSRHALEAEKQPLGFRVAPALSIEVLHEDCLGGACGAWEIRSLSQDVVETEALGIELGPTSVQAAVLDLRSSLFVTTPVVVPLDPELAKQDFRQALQGALLTAAGRMYRDITVVGCSVTPQVALDLGLPDSSFTSLVMTFGPLLRKTLKNPDCFVHIMPHAEAFGYAEIAAAARSSEDLVDVKDDGFRQKLVMLVTLGEDLGAVLFRNGHRIQRSGLNTWISDRWPVGVKVPKAGAGSEWADYVDLVQNCLMEMVQLVQPDRLVLVPSGALLEAGASEALFEKLPDFHELAISEGIAVEVSALPEASAVRGAALASLVELRSTMARLEVRKALEGAASLQVLSTAQLRAAFDAFDSDGSGVLTRDELNEALESMGLNRDASDIFREFGDAPFNFDRFCEWWTTHVRACRVLTITSTQDLNRVVRKTMEEVPQGYGPLVVFEITYSYCRACKAFARKLERLAELHRDVRFVTMLANYNRASMALAKLLNVTKVPAFFMYRRGTDAQSPLAIWVGNNSTKLEEKLEWGTAEVSKLLDVVA